MEIVRVENLKKIYGDDENEVRALNGVSFSVEKGDFVAITGSSGSGKSTLLHLMGLVDTPTSGKVFINGEDVYTKKEDELAIYRRRQIGLIYQFYNLIPTLSVQENMTLPVLMDRGTINKERMNELLEQLGLTDRRKHLPNQLSGGQQQRVSIGRALINSPALVLADEPTGNLDTKNSREVVELLKYANQKYGQTIVMITHDEDIALQANRIITIRDGKIASDSRIREVGHGVSNRAKAVEENSNFAEKNERSGKEKTDEIADKSNGVKFSTGKSVESVDKNREFVEKIEKNENTDKESK